MPRARLLLGCVLCVESIRPLVGCPALPFIDQGGSRGYRWEKEEKNQRQRKSFEGAGSSFSLDPALLIRQIMPGIACSADPDEVRL